MKTIDKIINNKIDQKSFNKQEITNYKEKNIDNERKINYKEEHINKGLNNRVRSVILIIFYNIDLIIHLN